MEKLIVYPLLILFFLAGFNQLYLYTAVDFSANTIIDQNITSTQTLNSTETSVGVAGGVIDLQFTMATGLVIISISAIALGLIGLNVVGSGLGGMSVKIIWNGLVYYGIWALFSALGLSAFVSIPYFGVFLWFIMTGIYTLGIFEKMGGESKD